MSYHSSQVTQNTETITIFNSVCIFNTEAYIAALGEVPSGDTTVIGHIETDGVAGFTEEEQVHLGDSIEEGVTVYMQCSNWWVIIFY